MGEITVNVPDPEPPRPAPAAPAAPSTEHLAMALGEMRGELSAQKSATERLLQELSDQRHLLEAINSRTELLVSDESDPTPDEQENPEPVSIPPPLLVDPTTAESEHREEPKKRYVGGMLHGW